MVLIPKTKITEKVDNPMRPKIGLPKSHTTCRLSWGDYHVEYDEIEQRIVVDADHSDEFIAELEATVPKEDRWKCLDREVWFVDKKWKSFLVSRAKEYFDEAIIKLREW